MIKKLKNFRYLKWSSFAIFSFFSIIVIAIFVLIIYSGIMPFFKEFVEIGSSRPRIFNFLFSTVFDPANGKYGVFWMLVNSIWITLFALLIAMPISVMTSITISKFLKNKTKQVMIAVIQSLSAVPSVIFGIFGAYVINNIISRIFPGSIVGSSLSVIFTLACMLIPTITTLTTEALENVNKNVEKSSLALGATKLQTSIFISLKASKLGIINGAILAIGRALGEATAVSIVASSVNSGPNFDLLGPIQTLTTAILVGFSELAPGSFEKEIRFSMTLLLFILVILTFNSISVINNYFSQEKQNLRALKITTTNIYYSDRRHKILHKKKLTNRKNKNFNSYHHVKYVNAKLFFSLNQSNYVKAYQEKLLNTLISPKKLFILIRFYYYNKFIKSLTEAEKRYFDNNLTKKELQLQSNFIELEETREYKVTKIKDNKKGFNYLFSTLSILASGFVVFLVSSIVIFLIVAGSSRLNWNFLSARYHNINSNYYIEKDVGTKSCEVPKDLKTNEYYIKNHCFGFEITKLSNGQKVLMLSRINKDNSSLRKAYFIKKIRDRDKNLGVVDLYNMPRMSLDRTYSFEENGNINVKLLNFNSVDSIKEMITDLNSSNTFSFSFLTINRGISESIFTTILFALVVIIVSLPFAILICVFSREYQSKNKFTSFVKKTCRKFISLLSGIPSLVFGLIGAFLFSFIFANNTFLIAVFTLIIIVVPVMIRIIDQSLASVNKDQREASYALGSTTQQTILRVIIPQIKGGIVTSIILGIGRVFAESAALIVILGPIGLGGSLIGRSTLATHIWSAMKTGRLADIATASAIGVIILAIVWILFIISRKISKKDWWGASLWTGALLAFIISTLFNAYWLFIISLVLIFLEISITIFKWLRTNKKILWKTK